MAFTQSSSDTANPPDRREASAADPAAPSAPAPTDGASGSGERTPPPVSKTKTRRPPNEVDFWRGYALLAIFINHIPGNLYEATTHKNFGVSDSAELFVFLAGFSLRYLSESRSENLTTTRLFMRLEGRAFTLYTAQMLIVSVALAMMAGAALWLETPLILQWNNAAAFFENPTATQIGIATLSHQMGYFDILPLYVVLMAAAPFIVLLHRASPWSLLLVSAGVWAAALVTRTNIPTWPVDGVWFFNPLAWQFDFVLGFVLARPTGLGALVRRHARVLRLFGLLAVLGGGLVTWLGWYPDPFSVPEPRLFFIFDKTYLTPARLLHMLGLVALFAGLFDWLQRWKGFGYLANILATLGRNSLHVFCAGSLLSLAGQIARVAAPVGIVSDTIVVISGAAILFLVAWLNEWRINIKG